MDKRFIGMTQEELRNTDLTGVDLSGADLRGIDLSDANLSDANLKGANLYGANLRGANLFEADLRDANLRDVNLSEANLSDAKLNGLVLEHVNLRKAIFDYTKLDNVTISRSDLSYAYFENANLTGVFLASVNLTGARLRNANFKDAELRDIDLSNADLTNANLKNVFLLKGITLTEASLEGAKLPQFKELKVDFKIPKNIQKDIDTLIKSMNDKSLLSNPCYHRNVLQTSIERAVEKGDLTEMQGNRLYSFYDQNSRVADEIVNARKSEYIKKTEILKDRGKIGFGKPHELQEYIDRFFKEIDSKGEKYINYAQSIYEAITKFEQSGKLSAHQADKLTTYIKEQVEKRETEFYVEAKLEPKTKYINDVDISFERLKPVSLRNVKHIDLSNGDLEHIDISAVNLGEEEMCAKVESNLLNEVLAGEHTAMTTPKQGQEPSISTDDIEY